MMGRRAQLSTFGMLISPIATLATLRAVASAGRTDEILASNGTFAGIRTTFARLLGISRELFQRVSEFTPLANLHAHG